MNESAPSPYAPDTWRAWLEQQDALSWLFGTSSLPEKVALSRWSPSVEDQAAAWQFLVELRSRVTTQTLSFRAGTEDAALQSIVGMFESFRKVAKEHPGASHFTLLALQLLNVHVRPFTSYWHPLREKGLLRSVDYRVTFRAQLTLVQSALRKGAELLAVLAGSTLLSYPDAEPLKSPRDHYIAPLPLSLVDSDSLWKDMFEAELSDIRQRRAHRSANVPDILMDGVGLALSGGGIRSATFSLGVITVLARKGILSQVDYLSTVSGGGYLGAFLSSTLGHATANAPVDELFGPEGQPETIGPRALRDHSKYLIEGGIRTAATIAGLVTYGLVTTLLLVLPALLLLAAVIRCIPVDLSWWALGLPAGISLLGYAVTAIGQRVRRAWIESTGIWIGLIGFCLLILAFAWYYNFEKVKISIQLVGWIAISIGFASFALFVPSLAKTTRQTFGVLVAALMLSLAWLTVTALASITSETLPVTGILLYAAIVTFLFTSLFIDLNAASPQRYYRARLAKTYLITANGEPRANGAEKLSGLNPSGHAPYHLLNAALNIPGSKNVDLRGRRTDFFIFSKHYCGSLSSGIYPTKDWEKADCHLDLATAVATSGAAAAPNMGTNRASRFRYLLAMLNLRLCYWLRNPQNSALFSLNPSRYFWHELRGNMSESLPYLNLSDGGHIENLGIYELLRRRCKFIIAVDGEADPDRSFGGLLTLVQLARIDFGVDIDPDLSDLRVDDQGVGQSHFELFRIRYPDEGHGVLVYIKASMTGDESEFLKRYRKEHPDFPHESTAKQLYSERQFEAYRSLGEHIAAELFRQDLVGDWKEGPVKDWVQRLSAHLLSR